MANRKKQIEFLQKKAAELSAEAEALKDEIDESLTNLPDNLQDSRTAEVMQERIDALDAVVDALDDFASEVL